MHLVCRLCLSTDTDVGFENILSCKIYKSQESLIDLIYWIYRIEIDSSDPYSKCICINCIGLVENIVSSSIFFQQNQEKLEKIKDTPERSQERSNKTTLRNNTTTSKPRSIRKDSRIKVKVADLSALNPFFVKTERLENSLEFTKYKPIGNGAFKSLRYRQFRMDDSLLEDICNLLDSGQGSDADSESDIDSDLVQEIYTVGQDLFRSDDSDSGSEKKMDDIIGSTKCLPQVCLEPVEFLLERDSWEVVNDFTYKKTENEPCIDTQSNDKQSKKQKFLDYYNNFSSLAVRELIAGKTMREPESFIKVSNVLTVLVCQFCSETCSSEESLKEHNLTAHGIDINFEEIIDVDVEEIDEVPCSKFSLEKFRQRMETFCTKRTKNDNSSSNKKIRLDNQPLQNGHINLAIIDTPERSKRITKHYADLSSANIVSSVRNRRPKCHYSSTARKRKKPIATKPKKSEFVWERQGLGKYSAISFYQTPAGNSDAKSNNFIRNGGLGSTIKRLTGRLSSVDN